MTDNMQNYYNTIMDKLDALASTIKRHNKHNLIDRAVLSENFYAVFLNTLNGWKLKNKNIREQNEAGIDLVSQKEYITVQVSSQKKGIKEKIQDSLNKIDKKKYNGYRFFYLAIGEEIREKLDGIVVPDGIKFSIENAWDLKKIDEKVFSLMGNNNLIKLKILAQRVEEYYGDVQKVINTDKAIERLLKKNRERRRAYLEENVIYDELIAPVEVLDSHIKHEGNKWKDKKAYTNLLEAVDNIPRNGATVKPIIITGKGDCLGN